MGRRLPIFYNALMLTGVNLLLRFISTSFQVFLSGRIGAAGIGLLQLVMSVASMTMTAGMAGIRTTAMYLTAEELGKARAQNVTWVLSACFLYSLVFSGGVGALVYGFAPNIAQNWIGDLRTVGAIRLFAAFLPVNCFVGVMVGYFTAAGRIATLAAVEVAEQVCSMAVTTLALLWWAGEHTACACLSVVLGSCLGGVLTLSCLMILRLRERADTGPRISVARRLTETALPLAVADDLKVGINTVENLMVPKRLSLFTTDALAQFGMVSGMVFPVMMFPAAILYGLADLLIPELARCNAAGSPNRIRYLARRSLRVALLYGIGCGGVLFALSDILCQWLYKNSEAGQYLACYALLVPMLYCDAIIDAMNKGLGLQKICVRVNIFTAALDVLGLYVLLPRFGMWGYFASFFATHLINAGWSLWLLLRKTGLRMPLRVPVLVGLSIAVSVLLAKMLHNPAGKTAVFLLAVYSILWLAGVIYIEDLQWLRNIISLQKKSDNL
ncbi:MAG: polysaccharide biosynthesis C-terminal domain-containing protein [Oscillospiraceae bacterium]|nr:polysaccharide biosynthesis C-terminal domain-containing protein [Oscillospiraceae bacterium]